MQYKVLFVGLGSIGQKHLKNLKSVAEVKVDALRTKNEPFEGIENVYTSYDEVPNDYDIVFITNPTSCHHDAIMNLKVLDNTWTSYSGERQEVTGTGEGVFLFPWEPLP